MNTPEELKAFHAIMQELFKSSEVPPQVVLFSPNQISKIVKLDKSLNAHADKVRKQRGIDTE
jgi:hypothetical protein